MPPHALLALRLPTGLLLALDDRTVHFWMQPMHFLIRTVHVLSVAAFFGAILLLDLQLIRRRNVVSLRELARQALPAAHASFGLAMVTGIGLFFYDPVHVGAHAYFVPKLALIGLGLLNAFAFHQTSYAGALAANGSVPAGARISGAMSILFWTGVLVCACLDTEAAPRVLLRW